MLSRRLEVLPSFLDRLSSCVVETVVVRTPVESPQLRSRGNADRSLEESAPAGDPAKDAYLFTLTNGLCLAFVAASVVSTSAVTKDGTGNMEIVSSSLRIAWPGVHHLKHSTGFVIFPSSG